ncbi:MAG: hypothetical protein WC908_03230 [Candidatus Paceibacterota bacterium]
MTWASSRQFKYLSIFLLVVGLIVFAFIYPLIFKKPTCTDSKQNGAETGVDCGGACLRMCLAEVSDPVVLWSRAFPVVGSNYNLIAFIENRNKNSGVYSAPYEFRVYDVNNKLLGRRQGSTFIPPNQQFAVFESRFDAGESELKSITFEFLPPLVWIKKSPTLQTLPINVSNIVFDDNKDTPNLSAIISNASIYDLPEFDVIAILYDAEHNAINASKTYKDKLLSGDNLPVVFTWPEILSSIPVIKDVLIQINPFSVSF